MSISLFIDYHVSFVFSLSLLLSLFFPKATLILVEIFFFVSNTDVILRKKNHHHHQHQQQQQQQNKLFFSVENTRKYSTRTRVCVSVCSDSVCFSYTQRHTHRHRQTHTHINSYCSSLPENRTNKNNLLNRRSTSWQRISLTYFR